ncbi:MAG TPA: alpha/beta hydrolase [Nocardioides sp.]|uniref:alpha/beta hydrolase n=1 Tax=Nocardioides sp. TaxID=35761 RepID=UPI002E30E730|nr:alpha/beta hydrolase [Nocardioides sp.]HEX5090083.1 alpha/beta hydrolase [Nocardioides sp.]
MEASPRLVAVREPSAPEGAVVVLHGGASRGDRVLVSPTQLSVVRMIPTARTVARAGRGRLAVYRLLNRYRGWDSRHTPVDDADWALDLLCRRFPGVPLGLVGHSLGGRAALLAGDHEAVRSVVALNPWVYPDDHAELTGRRVLVVHGLCDRVASPARARSVVRNLSRTADVEFVPVPAGKHAMVGHHREFDGRAAAFTADVLLGLG